MDDIAKGLKHLKRCHPRLGLAVNVYPKPSWKRSNNFFWSLCKIIVSQQLSTKAARSITARLRDELERELTPSAVMTVSEQKLRRAGLSSSKASAMKHLAAAWRSKLSRVRWSQLNDVHIAEKLLAIKGLGPWSVDMFLIFCARRLDVLPLGDLGCRKGLSLIFTDSEHCDVAELEQLLIPARPYRSLTAWYAWRAWEEPGALQ